MSDMHDNQMGFLADVILLDEGNADPVL